MSNETIKKLKTPLGKSYWDNTGVYQEEYNKLSDELVPSMGNCETIHGELLRSIGNLSYDFFNNGNCNSLESVEHDCGRCGGSGWEQDFETCYDCDDEGDCDSCGGSGEIETDVDCGECGGECTFISYFELRSDFKEQFDLLAETFPDTEEIINLRKFYEDTYLHISRKNYFSDKNTNIFDAVADMVIYHVLTTENKSNPNYKKEE